ncbi:MAG: enoyl-CoA hydratase-related protein [Chloroflexota bacterium]
MPAYTNLRVEQDGEVQTLTLDRPKVNAFDFQLAEDLLDALARAAEEENVRCLVLTGAGKSFSAGQDVQQMHEVGPRVSYRQHLERSFNAIVLVMRQMDKPILGAINGTAAGAGLGIALATDLRLAAESARFVFGFTALGLSADSGVSLFLTSHLGLARAAEMAFTNQPLCAQQALQAGLVNRLVPDADLLPEAQALAAALAAGPTRALGLIKRALHFAAFQALEAVLDYEGSLQEIASRTADHREGVAAFLEKRPPTFHGH